MKNKEETTQIINGTTRYYRGDVLYREDEHVTGIVRYYENDILHKVDGPAKIWPDGRQEWWIHGELHREDGPAIMDPWSNDSRIEVIRYFIKGMRFTEQEFLLYKIKNFLK